MTKRRAASWLAAITFILCCGTQMLLAQEKQKQDASPAVAYRLDYSINELEDGKKINTRQYSMNLSVMNDRVWDGDTNEIKIGARVPVESETGKFQYLDVGTNIWSRLRQQADTLTLEVRAELGSIAAAPEQQSPRVPPVVRQVRINGSTVVIPGKAMALGVVDDPTSKRQFQLEVTVTKLR